MNLYIYLGVESKLASTLASISIIFIASLLTGIGVFDKIARVAGGGTLLPISGFANSISSQAIDSKSEGFITGVGAKIFTIAGPVILYGLLSGTIYGIILFFISTYGG
jgi:stage V sporulation protein AC